jgi:hypothetical protein
MVPSSLSAVSSRTSTVSPGLGGGPSLPSGLVPDVDHDVVAADLEHLAGDDLVGFVVLLGTLNPIRDCGVEVFVALVEGVGVVGGVELAEEVAVDHSVR